MIVDLSFLFFFFFFNDTATTEIYTLSLHDALPIWRQARRAKERTPASVMGASSPALPILRSTRNMRSEEHTSELQSQSNLVCRLLLEKKKKNVLALIVREEDMNAVKLARNESAYND